MARRGKEADCDTAYLFTGRRKGQCAEKCDRTSVPRETRRREARDQLKNASKPKRGQKRINNDTNFLEASFGETTSPFVRDLKTPTKLTLDMAKPTE
jgi:hypothetical protein